MRRESGMKSVRLGVVAIVLALIAFQTRAVAERSWVEVKSPHFIIVSSESERTARTVAWQFEQMHGVLNRLWAWARVDTAKPIFVFAVGDEAGMRALAPQFWEQKDSVRPASVFVEAADRYLVALRSDLRAEDREGVNPYITAYWSYVALVLNASLDRDLPLWFQRGLAGVFSNTIVRETSIQLGRVIPWHLRRLQQGSRLSIRDLLAVDRQSPWYTQGDRLDQFDAETWAFMHFLMFGDDGAHRSQLDRFMALLHAGKAAPAALEEGFGNPDALKNGFSAYFTRQLYQYQRVDVDTRTTKEGFQARSLPPSESAGLRAAFHAAMNRPVEARAALEEARKADARLATTYETEGILFDSDRKNDNARAAYAKAVELGSRSFFAYYRLAALTWVQDADSDTLASNKKSLEQSIGLNDRFAPAFGLLGEANAHLGRPEDALNAARRAVSLDGGVTERLSLARVLWTISRPDEATSEARNALTSARTAGERRTAQELVDFFEKNRR
jgi:tetratricopeptide (TPR) repeat protein